MGENTYLWKAASGAIPLCQDRENSPPVYEESMIKISIAIDETMKEFDYQKAHDIYESLHEYAVIMEIEKIKSKVIFERSKE